MDKHPDSKNEWYDDGFIRTLLKIVAWNVKLLAVLMLGIILWATLDVIYHLLREIWYSPTTFFNIDDLIGILGTFLGVLIAIEVFLNIIFYLRRDEVHVPLVIATALTAVARKVIIFDYAKNEPLVIFGVAAVIFALGITYWLVAIKK